LSGSIEEKLFARKSSGLIKEASGSQALFFNILNVMGGKFPWSMTILGLFPAGLMFGYSPYLFAVILFGLASCILGVIYVQIVTPMPRSGADYVVPARLMGPFWGWINSWMIVWSYIPIWAFATWVAVRNVKVLFDILSVPGITPRAPWILVPPGETVIGIAIMLVAICLVMLPPRKYYRIIAVTGVLAVISLVVIAIGTAFNNPTVFDKNLQSLVGVSMNGLMQTATKDGFDPNGGFSLVSLAGLAGYVLFVTGGFQTSASISGELRGDVKKSLTFSILGSLAFFIAFSAFFVWYMVNQFGYNFTLSWSYLFWNFRGSAPLSLPPINALMTTISAPNLWFIWLFASAAGVIGAFMLLPTSMLYVNRLILAWGIDRMLPRSIAQVHPKYRQPTKIILIQGVLAVIFYLVLVYLPNFNPTNFPYWSTLMVMPSYIFPAICALLLPRRRPDLEKIVPWRKWLKPVAIIWLIFIIPFYAFAGFIGSVPQPTSGTLTGLWQYAISTGLIAALATVLIGAVIFFVVRAYNKKRGIDVDKLFKTIPPE